MRKNLPVTGNEVVMQDGRPIVSKTDLKGNITYVNPYFLEVSGYTEEELLGEPHNIVRHPDMPEAAYKDFWETIQSGETWSGVIKNRCKNGDHYWVKANVTPITSNGRVTGYMSVRTKPDRRHIEEAISAYAELNKGANAKLLITKGHLEKVGLIYDLWRAAKMPYNKRLALVMVAQLFVFAVVMAASFFGPAGTGLPWWGNAALVMAVLMTLEIWAFQHIRVGKPLEELTQYAQTLAGGDLAGAKLPTHAGEAGRLLGALHQLDANLLAAIGDIYAHAQIIQTATAEIAAGNLDLSSRTESQASSLEQTAASMDEFASTVENNAKFAEDANALAHNASGVAREGGEAIINVGKTMAEISAASHRITDIIGVIDGIAFQTNILALNAAVEAARAGEAGRGFAVVASEVRALAQRSGSAAKEIRDLIHDSVEKVDAGNQLVDSARGTMDHVVKAVVQVAGIMGDIANASKEQAIGIKQVNEAITLMDNITQQNAALVEQAAAGAENLYEEAVHLGHAVSVLNTGAHTTTQVKKPVKQAAAQTAPALKTNLPRLAR